MITSLPVTPGERFPLSRTLATLGTCHHVTPVAQMLAASVRTTGVPNAAAAPYKFECESLATTMARANRNIIAGPHHRIRTEPISMPCGNFLDECEAHISYSISISFP